MLIDLGANIKACNEWGETALHLAAEKNQAGVVSKLIKMGADTEARDENGDTPII